MNKKILLFPLGILAIILFASFANQKRINKISMVQESSFLANGIKVVMTSEIFYNHAERKMVTKFGEPYNYIIISNDKGEAKVYYPKENKVLLTQGMSFNTENSLLYYFLANKINDLGLSDLGFRLNNTKYEDDLMISEFVPMNMVNSKLSKVELVHKNFLPVYVAYYNDKNEVVQKIFYYQYQNFSYLNLPMKAVEYSYVSPKDSSITRKIYSNVNINDNASSEYFNFKIPEDASVITK